jgi:hypothetical protein
MQKQYNKVRYTSFSALQPTTASTRITPWDIINEFGRGGGIVFLDGYPSFPA